MNTDKETGRQTKAEIEKIQKDVDQERNAFMSSLPEEEKAKYDAVEKAVKILNDAGVAAYIFGMLPIYNEHGVPGMLQYNTLSQFLEYNEDEMLTKEAAEKIGIINDSFLYGVFSLPVFKKFRNPTDTMVYLSSLFQYAISRDMSRYTKAKEEREKESSAVK